MQAGEGISIPALAKELEKECPFQEEDVDVAEVEDENIARDDLQTVMRAQANNGGTLGKNLSNASPGKPATLNKLYLPNTAEEDRPKDTKRNRGGKVKVTGDTEQYP